MCLITHDDSEADLRESLLNALSTGDIAGNDESREVTGRTAGDEDASRGCRHSSDVCHDSQCLILGDDGPGCLEPRAALE